MKHVRPMTPIKPQTSFCKCNGPAVDNNNVVYPITNQLHQQKDICFMLYGFIDVMGLTCLIKLVRFFIFAV